ncbi:MAG: phenylalanine--tRNA ligase subunit beta [Candidatus Pacearchaeota archaeon]|jgi:phenylalanyl-tRNA synthetase beta chain
MAILNINRKTFEKEVGKLSEEMQEKIAMFGTPIEDLNDNEMQVEIFPNRPDLLSYHNYRNSLLAFLGKKTGLIKVNVNKPEKDFKVVIDKSVSDVRPYTVCAIVKGLKFDDEKIKEIIDIQEKLHMTLGRKRKKAAIGIYPLEKIKLPIRFEARKPEDIKFIPLEAGREMNGRQILSQHAAGREYGFLLEGLNKYPVFVDANNEVLSMPPIINSHKTGKIDEKTRDIFIECSGFDLNVLNKILNIVVASLYSMGGKVCQMTLEYGSKKIITPDFEPEKMKINVAHCNKLLGLDLNESQINKLLEKMGYGVKGKEILIPAWRTDVLHEVDLIEDVAIAYGYDNFIPEIPLISTIGEQDKKEIVKRKIAEVLTGLGLLETSSYHLTTKEMQIKNTEIDEKDVVEVKNSKTEYNLLRRDLTHYMLKILSENVDVEYPQEIFQSGIVFEGLKEKEHLSIALAPGDFTRTKQIIEYLGRMIDVQFEFKNGDSGNYYINGRTADIVFNGKVIGKLGEVHPKILKNFKIKMPVTLMEIDFDEILK